MTVKQLILELLELPMDSIVCTAQQEFDGSWITKEANCVGDYEDGYVGILSSLRTKEV